MNMNPTSRSTSKFNWFPYNLLPNIIHLRLEFQQVSRGNANIQPVDTNFYVSLFGWFDFGGASLLFFFFILSIKGYL